MKLTQIYNVITEANEAILAQGACKNAMFISQKHVNTLLKQLQSAGFIKPANSKVKVYNQGYELVVTFGSDWKVLMDLGENKARMVNSLLSSIYLQPSSFFDSYLRDDGKATIEGRTFEISKAMSYDEKYPKYVVKSKADIKKVQKLYSDEIKQQCDYIVKQLGL